MTVTEIAAHLRMHPSTVREAKRENRLRFVRGEPVVLARRPCANPACQFRLGISGASKLCQACLDAGLRWCCLEKHVVPVAVFLSGHYCCRPCYQADDRARKLAARGITDNTPPAGYIRLTALAPRLHYSRDYLLSCIKRGWMAGHTWMRGPSGVMYVEDRAEYPPLPSTPRRRKER